MTSLKALLPLAVLLLLSVAPTETTVVKMIEKCVKIFVKGNPPNIAGILEGANILDQNRYKPICQTFRNTRTFVTLYDTKNKIPVFSAGKYIGDHEGKRPKPSPWMIEPQLEDTKGDNSMAPENNQETYKNQAVKKDYENKLGYDKGHLFPCCYGFNQIVKTSTFTLTNIVPQNINFNGGTWKNMEQCIKCVMDHYCSNKEAYVVTGALHSTGKTLNNRVNIPSMLWSAFCCYNSEKKQWLASAFWGKNTEPESNYLDIKTLGSLHKELGIEVFPETECPSDTTVATVYPDLYSKCNCKDKA
ncbi:endonuclease domain-containing 1 protein-like [Mugil cephalus]|uniref:endonuclease domain-containing 1 protein-like n=1 Tax=Mugil cephalus TaxID=48193 RepID=UPI001FB63643|nr:endonuclease domain-containing 1 protein-like [Mugil cephalus]XP_047452277.1 endonuclease domain-containing 1 protein-like [Mugil cephalus]XP_047452287.1 endonuclease domain-containing 1 protein-like [Mugil cephalus]